VLDLLCDWACFDVPVHISYRFRLVSISCDPSFTFSIDGHSMTIIEVEGTNVQPLVVDSLDIFVGTHGSYFLVPY
jgi:iron transport multicopper oxidase